MGYRGRVPLAQLLRSQPPPQAPREAAAEAERRRQRGHRPLAPRFPTATGHAPAPDVPASSRTGELAGLSPLVRTSPRVQERVWQEARRADLWRYCQEQNYNPWHRLIVLGCDPHTPVELQIACHKEIAAYLLPKLKAVEVHGTIDHTHTSVPLQALFAALEQAEEQERATLPPWTPPALLEVGPAPMEDDHGEDEEA